MKEKIAKMREAVLSFNEEYRFIAMDHVKIKDPLGYNFNGSRDAIFMQYINPIFGADDDPLNMKNFMIADCFVMVGSESEDKFHPILMDSRFIEPAELPQRS